MHVLLVEDSDEVSCITVEYLHELEHEVVAVSDAEHALAKIAALKFDVVITDVRLPGMSGIELARKLVKQHPQLPVIIASGYGAIDMEILMGEKLHNVLMLPKPYDLDDLRRTLNSATTPSP
jgi:DNA-binding NtrC family response regulator